MTGAAGPDPLPLSAAQREIWLGQRLGNTSGYRVGQYLDIRGTVDCAALAAAVRQTVDEAESVRVRFVEDARGPRQLVEPAVDWAIPVLDLRGESDPVRVAEDWMRNDLAESVGLDTGRLFSCALFVVDSERYLLFHGYHQITMDAVGVFLMARRIAAVYNAMTSGVPGDGPTFGTLRQLLASDSDYRYSARFQEDQNYWREQLRGHAVPELTPARSRGRIENPIHRTSYLTVREAEDLKGAGRQSSNLAAAVVAALAVHRYQLSGDEDVVLGLAVTGRSDPVLRRIPGMVSNLLPVRLAVRARMSRAELLRQVSERIFELLMHGRYRGEDIVRDCGIPVGIRTLIGPLVNVFPFRYDLSFGSSRAVPHNLTPGLVNDLTVAVYDRSDGRDLKIEFSTFADLYDVEQLASYQDGLLSELRRFGSAPDLDRPIGAEATP
jgi:hypothetical protein